jgi:hypothetical protein
VRPAAAARIQRARQVNGSEAEPFVAGLGVHGELSALHQKLAQSEMGHDAAIIEVFAAVACPVANGGVGAPEMCCLGA